MFHASLSAAEHIFRIAFAPALSDRALRALQHGLAINDPALIQGQTVRPFTNDPECHGACLIGYTGWRGEELLFVNEIQEYFLEMCKLIGEKSGEPDGIRYLTQYWDDTPRDVAIPTVLGWLDAELDRRATTVRSMTRRLSRVKPSGPSPWSEQSS